MIEEVGSYLLRLIKSRVKDYAGNILLAFEWIKEIVEWKRKWEEEHGSNVIKIYYIQNIKNDWGFTIQFQENSKLYDNNYIHRKVDFSNKKLKNIEK